MAKQSKLRKITSGRYTYWGSVIRGTKTRFGRADEVSYEEALAAFHKALAAVAPTPAPKPAANVVTVLELCDHHLEWVSRHRAVATMRGRQYYCRRFCQHVYGSQTIGSYRAETVGRQHLEHFLASLENERDARGNPVRGPESLWKFVVSIQAVWNWAVRPGEIFAANHKPMQLVEKPSLPKRDLTEDSLITDDELDFFFAKAEPYEASDILAVLHATGARPGELCSAQSKHFTPSNNQLTLSTWKNGRKTNRTRRIHLNPDSAATVARLVRGRPREAYIFNGPRGTPWTTNRLGKIWRKIRDGTSRAQNSDGQGGNCQTTARSHLTLYAFRHLWISQMLLAGEAIAKVAAMSGTSVLMIEKTYGHFFDDDMAASQKRLDDLRTSQRRQRLAIA